MTIDKYNEAAGLVSRIKACDAKIADYNKVLEKTKTSHYLNDELFVEVYDGGGGSKHITYVDRELVADMLSRAIQMYEKRKEKLERELDEL